MVGSRTGLLKRSKGTIGEGKVGPGVIGGAEIRCPPALVVGVKGFFDPLPSPARENACYSRVDVGG